MSPVVDFVVRCYTTDFAAPTHFERKYFLWFFLAAAFYSNVKVRVARVPAPKLYTIARPRGRRAARCREAKVGCSED